MSSASVDKKPKYSPEIRTLAYAMQNMSHAELCAAIIDIDDKAHKTGFKNGKFAKQSALKQELKQSLEAEARIDELQLLGKNGLFTNTTVKQMKTNLNNHIAERLEELGNG